jgi:hypothetical protein
MTLAFAIEISNYTTFFLIKTSISSWLISDSPFHFKVTLAMEIFIPTKVPNATCLQNNMPIELMTEDKLIFSHQLLSYS